MLNRRFIFMLSVFVLIFGGAVMALQAQQEVPYDVVLADLSTRVGYPVTLGDLSSYSWEQRVFESNNFGCSTRQGTSSRISGYIIRMRYQLVEYDYRLSFDRNTMFLCSIVSFVPTTTPTFTPSATPSMSATPSPTFTPTITYTPSMTFTPSDTPTVTPTLRRETVFCPGFLPTRLWIGDHARVTLGGSPNNVRESASVAATEVFEIPPGGVFTVIAGPVCDGEGRAWWQVQYRSRIGWTVEGQDNEYFTELITPTTESTLTPVPSQTTPSSLFATNTPNG